MRGHRAGMGAAVIFGGEMAKKLAFGVLLAALPWLSTTTIAQANQVGFFVLSGFEFLLFVRTFYCHARQLTSWTFPNRVELLPG